MTVRVLVVLDGTRFTFHDPVAGQEYFSVSFMLKALTDDPNFQVKKAHRQMSDPHGGTVDIPNFKFDTTDLSQFDVLWLIGDCGIGSSSPSSKVTEPELQKIAEFMDAGGGVLATGDHESIGADMCGRIPRVRTMRRWYWDPMDYPSDMPDPANAKPNWPVFGADRGDTTQPSADGHFYFDSQSDRTPQPLDVLVPSHPILQVPSGVLSVFPDHMHEGQVVEPWTTSADFAFNGQPPRPEYPTLASIPFESPHLLATGTVIVGHTTVMSPGFTGPSGGDDNTPTGMHPPIGVLGAYDGWKAGVGRVVTVGSFHHVLDVNLIGDPLGGTLGGPDSSESHAGFNNAPAVLADMAAFYVNTASWLARPPRALTFAVDKSTYGKDETDAHPMHAYDSALYVIADGLKPADFPGGPIDEMIAAGSANASQLMKLANWAPQIPSPGTTGITFTPIGVKSDDPGLPARVQRFTFAYRVTFTDINVFNTFSGSEVINIMASLAVSPAPDPVVAQLELVTDADPYFSNYGDGNTVGYLSADLRVFKAFENDVRYGMPLGPNPSDARAWILNIMNNMTSSDFSMLDPSEGGSALSLTTTTMDGRSIFNFALARVRLNGVSLPADNTRVFFRVFQAPTTASLTYTLDGAMKPQLGWRQFDSGGVRKVPLVGIDAGNSEYLSFPCFQAQRATNSGMGDNMTTQHDDKNVQKLTPGMGEQYAFFGAWLDTNQPDQYFPATPAGQPNKDGPYNPPKKSILDSLLMGVHQCLGAEIVFDKTPIPNNSTPGNSDKLAQRNIAYTTVANPGTPSSRTAVHTFEVRSSPVGGRPDELMIDWGKVPLGSKAAFYLPAVSADAVVALADRLYATHGLFAIDAHTIGVPVGGTSYVPLPSAGLANFAGLFTLDIPAGIVKGQRFDVDVRQLTTTGAQQKHDLGGAGARANAAREHHDDLDARAAKVPHGRSEKERRIRQAIYEARVAQSRSVTRFDWRTVHGGFQIAIPVSTKAEMLLEEARILSIMMHRASTLSANSRWFPVFQRYVEVLVARFEGLGGDPGLVRPSPGGMWPGIELICPPCKTHGGGEASGGGGGIGGLAPLDRLATIGKVDALIFDHFGDFEAFVIETEDGRLQRFDSREPRVLALARRAWEERITVAVRASQAAPHRPLEIVFLRGGV